MTSSSLLFPAAGSALPRRLAASECLALFDGHDWAGTALGPFSAWPEALKTAARLVMSSATAMALLAGPQGVTIYNDAYALIAGQRHPDAFGAEICASWPEAAGFNGQVLAQVFAGETLHFAEEAMTVMRNGAPEAVWFDLDYHPVYDEDGRVLAAMAMVSETTNSVRTARALVASREQLSLALSASAVVGIWDWRLDQNRVYTDSHFADMYGVEGDTSDGGAPIEAFLDGIDPQDKPQLLAKIQNSVETGAHFSAEYRLRGADGAVRWVLAEGQPILNEHGICQRLPGIAIDITQQKRAAEEAARSEAGFRILADTMPQIVWSTRPDGYHDYYNARWYEFTGTAPGFTEGDGWNGMFHEDDRERAWAAWRHCLETGDPYQIEYRLRHHSGVYRWVLGRALPMRDEAGRILRWYGTCTDIHEAKLAQAERDVVNHELSHRIKNIFSVLSSIISLSARAAPEARAFADQLRRRIDAMGRAHDFVRPQSHSAAVAGQDITIFGLIRLLLEPYSADDAPLPVRFEGEDAAIGDGAATPLALLIHELATNSAKYGALAEQGGDLLIRGERIDSRYRLIWTEKLPRDDLVAPQRQGFGSRLMSISVEGQLSGTLTRRFESDGVTVEAQFPLTALARSSQMPKA
ncbi:PAS domain-containing sensor histidine kinase [Rhizobium rhizosphaerae]|uniref:PAS domain-containing sensor histidine kinase n=1 Tax=Xaviernesmea rhizosphaerae TaxID=1672749 RepID=UPI00098EFE05|nr:PAS domain-containing protein [Xaviernesmea rhizosphaerae]